MPSPTARRPALGASRFGGHPDLPSRMVWPRNKKRRPLAFLAQIALADVEKGMPPAASAEGSLCFFYDANSQPWGHASDYRGWKIVAISRRERLERVAPPEGCEVFPSCALRALAETTLPSVEALLSRRDIAPGLAAAAGSRPRDYNELRTQLSSGERPRHRFGGHPDELQGHIDCRGCLQKIAPRKGINPFTGKPMVFAGRTLAGVPAGVRQLLRSRAPWRLLLQLDSDERLGWQWGDVGTLYFVIREADLVARRFDRVWLQLQCY